MARKPAVKPADTITVNPNIPSDIVTTNIIADSAAPSPLTDAPNNAEEKAEEKAEETSAAPPAAPVRFDVVDYMHGFLGGAPSREGGFSPLLGRALDVRLGRAEAGETGRAAEVNAILRAGYKAAQTIRIEAEVSAFTMTAEEVTTFCALVMELSEEKGAGKDARILAGVGRRMAAVEKAVKRAVKSTKLPRAEVTATGRTIAAAILDVDDGAENRRAYLRSYRA